MTNPRMSSIPGRLLERRGAKHARVLQDWCLAHNFRPTFAEIEAERGRRAQANRTPNSNTN